MWRHFLGPGTGAQRTPQAQRDYEAALVADLRAAAERYPADRRVRAERLAPLTVLGTQDVSSTG